MGSVTAERKEAKKRGGFKTMPFILSNEICDRFATTGFNANMVQYLRNELHLPLIQATNTLNNFAGTSSLTPIVGALIADSFAGPFWTISIGAILYQLGMLGVTISAILPALRPPPCPPQSSSCQVASTWQQTIFYLSLLLTAIGSGGTRPCVVAFGAEQLEKGGGRTHSKSEGSSSKGRSTFFNIYFFCIGISVMLALTVVVYIQDNVGWGLGFGIPTIAMFFSIIIFVSGYPLYKRQKPGGSPLTRVAQVVVAAMRKRKLVVPTDGSLLYQDRELDADISTAGRLLQTEQFRFLDRAAIVADGDIIHETNRRPLPWRLSTVHRVEEIKSIIRILPIWSAGILMATASSNNFTFAIVQAKSMDRHLVGSFYIPPATLFIFSSAAMLLTLVVYDRVLLPLARRLTGRPQGISHLRRMAIGLAIAVLTNIASALVETHRRSAPSQLNVFWLVPQYVLHGVSDGFASVGLMEFLYDQLPESMRSTAAALFWLSISMGHYGGTLLVTMVSGLTNKSSHGSWLQDDINIGRLDYYYWLVTGMQLFNLLYYLLCARFYVFKRLEVDDDDVVEDAEEKDRINVPVVHLKDATTSPNVHSDLA